MICINCDGTYQGKYRVVIQADTAPDTMPTTGEGVTGLADDATLAPGSILYVVTDGETYFLGEGDGEAAGTWIKWGAANDEAADDAEGGEG